MANYLVPEDDGLPMRESGPWVVEKLDYLRRYINIFENSMYAQPWRKRHYIDLFSGPGKCWVPDTKSIYLGSPLIALTIEHPFTDYYFVDLEIENVDALKCRTSSSSSQDHVCTMAGV